MINASRNDIYVCHNFDTNKIIFNRHFNMKKLNIKNMLQSNYLYQIQDQESCIFHFLLIFTI